MTTTTTITKETLKTKEPMEHKVFVGNLSFKTTKESLTAFAETSSKVVDAVIITRGRRSLGYGFVTYESEAEAKKAAEALDKKPLDGRDINAEVARPKAEPSAQDPAKTTKSRKTKKSKTEATSSDEDKKVRSSKKKKVSKGTPRAAEPSKTTLFIANLPYATTDDDLNKLFKDHKPVSAQVTRARSGRSKGYGFVQFSSEQDQLKAFEATKSASLEGRPVYLKIALSEPYSSSSSSEDESTKKEVKKTNKSEVNDVEVKKADKPEDVKQEEQKAKKADKSEVKDAEKDVKAKKAKNRKSTAKKAVEVIEDKTEALKINDTK